MTTVSTCIADNVAEVRGRIADAAISVNRDPSSVTLIAASKMQDSRAVQAAIQAGVDACGENKVQELVAKHAEGAYALKPSHFIGHLQRNKVSKVVGLAALIQSIGSSELASEVSERALKLGIVQDVLLEVNIGGEASKSGYAVDGFEDSLESALTLRGIRVRGLMCIPPVVEVGRANSEYFDRMAKIFVDNQHKMLHNGDVTYLSMGMSGDFEDAIRHGANMVRVGRAIFGSRYG
ncbi:MAG: YggS family pyridoxal phosphate-dependent enzyme [Oscillospiraceae bacterium]|jgi:pyridoxal phosphate enzyme (YggS family)|nr:YggS family pyridoxal phosphate-dependent enzyme [Oscillospiraceae bacterium]